MNQKNPFNVVKTKQMTTSILLEIFYAKDLLKNEEKILSKMFFFRQSFSVKNTQAT
jgi:hypothetical protein